MNQSTLRDELEALMSVPADRWREDEEVWDRELELIRRDPEALFAIAEQLTEDPDPDRREIALALLGGTAEYRP